MKSPEPSELRKEAEEQAAKYADSYVDAFVQMEPTRDGVYIRYDIARAFEKGFFSGHSSGSAAMASRICGHLSHLSGVLLDAGNPLGADLMLWAKRQIEKQLTSGEGK